MNKTVQTAVLATAMCAANALAQAWPSKPISLIVPFAGRQPRRVAKARGILISA